MLKKYLVKQKKTLGFQTIVKARPTSTERKSVLCYDLDQKENASFSLKNNLKISHLGIKVHFKADLVFLVNLR